MKSTVPYFLALFLILSCSKSDSNETEKEPPLSLPILTTASVSEITETSAVSGANISEDGGASITARGICWSTSTEPTLSDNKTTNAIGIGEFSSSLEDLDANTTYYVRSYAINNEGTAYGNEVSFTTLEPQAEAMVFEGDVLLTSQKEVDDFGEENYTEITGSLTIKDENFPHIQNLDSLDELSIVGGDLRIEDTFSIDFKNLNGLSSISSIKGGLILTGNYRLENITGLENLSELNSLEIINNGSLFFLTGLEKIIALENLEVSDNGQLRNFDGLSQLTSVENSVVIESNDGLQNINGLGQLVSIGGRLEVSFNNLLDDFCGLTLLIQNNGIAGDYVVENNSYNPTQQDIVDGNCS